MTTINDDKKAIDSFAVQHYGKQYIIASVDKAQQPLRFFNYNGDQYQVESIEHGGTLDKPWETTILYVKTRDGSCFTFSQEETADLLI